MIQIFALPAHKFCCRVLFILAVTILLVSSFVNAQPSLPTQDESMNDILAIRLEDPHMNYVDSIGKWNNTAVSMAAFNPQTTDYSTHPHRKPTLAVNPPLPEGQSALAFARTSLNVTTMMEDNNGQYLHIASTSGVFDTDDDDGSGDLEFTSSNGAEVFVVARVLHTMNTSVKHAPWTIGSGSATLYPAENGTIGIRDFTNSIHFSAHPQQIFDIFHVYNISSSDSGIVMRINNRIIYQNNVNTFAGTKHFTLGRTPTPSSTELRADSEIAAVLVYNEILTESIRDQVYEYLNYKYEIITEVPPAPSEVSAKALSPTQISLSWSMPAPEDVVAPSPLFFDVERWNGASWDVLDSVKQELFYLDDSVSTGTTYMYKLKAYRYNKGDIKSDYSDIVEVTTLTSGGGFPLGLGSDAKPMLWLVGENGAPGWRGTTVSWFDRSANHHPILGPRPSDEDDLTAITRQPRLIDYEEGYKPALRFDGTDHLSLPSAVFATGASPLWSGDELEMFCVLRVNDLDNEGRSWDIASASTGAGTYYPNSSGGITDDFFTTSATTSGGGDVGFKYSGKPTQPLDEYHLYNVKASEDFWESRINGYIHYAVGTRTDASLGYNDSTNRKTIGAHLPGATTTGFDGDIAAMILFDKALTTEQRWAVGTHLNNCYNFIRNAPSTPTLFLAKPISPTQIALSWLNPEPEEEWRLGGLEYELQRWNGSNWIDIATVDQARSYLDEGLTTSTSYMYQIRARNYLDKSEWATSITATTLSSGADFPSSDRFVWLTGDYAPTGTIGAWPDRSGVDHRLGLQIESDRQPALKENALYHKPSILFDGNDDVANSNWIKYFNFGMNYFMNLDASTGIEAFFVMKNIPVDPGASAGNFKSPWKLYSTRPEFPPTSGFFKDGFGSKTTFSVTDNNVPDLGRYFLYNVSAKDDDKWRAWFNIDPMDSNNGEFYYESASNIEYAVPSGDWYIGRNAYNDSVPSSTYRYKGEIVSVLIFDRALTSDERKAAREYMIFIHGLGDEDGDDLLDYWETEFLPTTDDLESGEDYDEDGLNDEDEYEAGSNPTVKDTDGDGLWDGPEVHTYLTDPASFDTDGDGLSDGWEIVVNLENPMAPYTLFDPVDMDEAMDDPDQDGLDNLEEFLYFDIVQRSIEEPFAAIENGQFITIGEAFTEKRYLNPFNPDCNEDGILDGVSLWMGVHPLAPDVDCDGVTNATEVLNGWDPLSPDTDQDGCYDGVNTYGGTGYYDSYYCQHHEANFASEDVDDYQLDPERCKDEPGEMDMTAPMVTLTWPFTAVLQ
jgi:hypothetical protein